MRKVFLAVLLVSACADPVHVSDDQKTLGYSEANVFLTMYDTYCPDPEGEVDLDYVDLDTDHPLVVGQPDQPCDWEGVPYCYLYCAPGFPSTPCQYICPHVLTCDYGTELDPDFQDTVTVDFYEGAAYINTWFLDPEGIDPYPSLCVTDYYAVITPAEPDRP